MDLKNINIEQIIHMVMRYVAMITSWVILLMVAATVARTQGWTVPYIRTMDPTPLAYLCGAWWLYKKAG